MLSSALKSSCLSLALIAAAVLPAVAHAGLPANTIAPGTYYFAGSCVNCQIQELPLQMFFAESSTVGFVPNLIGQQSPASATLTIDPNGTQTFSFQAESAFQLQSEQVIFTTGTTPTDNRAGRTVQVGFLSGGNWYDFQTAATGSWNLLGPMGASGSNGTWATTAPVPEPQSWALMLAGLAAAGAVARRRRQG